MTNEATNPKNRLSNLPPRKKGSLVDRFIRDLMPAIIEKLNQGWALYEIYSELKSDMPSPITEKTFETKYRIIRKKMVDEGVPGITPGTPGRPRKPR